MSSGTLSERVVAGERPRVVATQSRHAWWLRLGQNTVPGIVPFGSNKAPARCSRTRERPSVPTEDWPAEKGREKQKWCRCAPHLTSFHFLVSWRVVWICLWGSLLRERLGAVPSLCLAPAGREGAEDEDTESLKVHRSPAPHLPPKAP